MFDKCIRLLLHTHIQSARYVEGTCTCPLLQSTTGIPQFQTVVKLEKESLPEVDPSQDAHSLASQFDVNTESTAPDRSSVERAPLSNRDARASSPKPPVRSPAKNLAGAVLVGSARNGKAAEVVRAARGELMALHDPGHGADSKHVAMAGSEKPRALNEQNPVQPEAVQVQAAKARKSQTSSSSEAQVSSDDEDTNTNESPCWRSSPIIETRRRPRPGPRRTVPGKPEGPQQTAVSARKVGRKTVRRRREIPYAAGSKDDAKKFRGVTRKYGSSFTVP